MELSSSKREWGNVHDIAIRHNKREYLTFIYNNEVATLVLEFNSDTMTLNLRFPTKEEKVTLVLFY